MYHYYYEKEADAVNYIYFERYKVTGGVLPHMMPHYHDSIEFVFMVRGRNRVHINTESKIVQAGEATFVRCFEPHFYIPEEGAEYYVVLISSKYLDSSNDFMTQTFPSFMGKNAEFPRILEFLDYVFDLWENANETMRKGFAEFLLGLMKAYYPMEGVKNKKSMQAFVEVLKFINENFREELSLELLASRFGYSKNYLSELFNEFTGMNLREYINRCRINEFYRLKEEQVGSPLCRLAERCGFNSLNTFYRVLHKYPDQFRNIDSDRADTEGES